LKRDKSNKRTSTPYLNTASLGQWGALCEGWETHGVDGPKWREARTSSSPSPVGGLGLGG
jgi:hypothetical protein